MLNHYLCMLDANRGRSWANLSAIPQYISKFVRFLQDATWDATLRPAIIDFIMGKRYTVNEIDNLIMSATKSVETTLKKTIATIQSKSVPKTIFGVNLLNHALGCGLVKGKNDPLYSLIYYLLREPRNTSHHEFTVYTFNAIAQFMLETNAAIQQIKSRKRGDYTGTLDFSFDDGKTIKIEKARVLRPNGTQLPPDQKVEVRFTLSDNSAKTILLKPDKNGFFVGDYDARGLPAGTLWWDLIGVDEGKPFTTVSGSLAVMYPSIGTKCPNCDVLIDYGSWVCSHCGYRLTI